jgi:predicted nucleic acid-binding protein
VTGFVLDNSVTMRWCFDHGSHAYADAILQRLIAADSEAFVPILGCYEVSAVLARAQNAGTLSTQKAMEFMEDLQALNIVVDAHTSFGILTDVHRLALSYRLSSYDAAYLELSLRLNVPIATLDAELRRACKNAGVSVL